VFKRDEDFTALYANSVVSEHSIWDLKVIFGILDQSVSPMQVVQHTSINLPWVQVKLLSYYLNVAIAIQESYNGKIVVPPVVMPPDPQRKSSSPMGCFHILSFGAIAERQIRSAPAFVTFGLISLSRITLEEGCAHRCRIANK
jgi:hypothetical protein